MTYTLTRENMETGAVFSSNFLSLRDCGQMVFFCAMDNVGLPKSSAARHGALAEQAFRSGKAYALNQYEFRAVSR